MPTGATFNVIYIGNFADLAAPAGTTGAYTDVDLGNTGVEPNLDVIVGSYDNSDMQLVEMTAYHRAEDTLIGLDEFGSSAYDNGQEGVEYTVVGGNSVGDGIGVETNTPIGTPPPDYNNGTTGGIAIDNHVYMNAVVTVFDPVTKVSTDVNKIVSVFQTDNGDVFVQEYANSNSSTFNLDGLTITDIELVSEYSNAPSTVRDNWTIDSITLVCFAQGTMISVEGGSAKPVEDLKQGDLVQTADHGDKAIKWISSRHISSQELADNPKLRPIRIQAGALGNNLPESDLVVSPQHRMLVRSKIAIKMFGEHEVLVAAKHLVLLDGVDVVDDLDEVTYYHFLFDQHEIVFANGAESESLYTGPEALKSLSPEARTEVFTIFPELTAIDYQALSARTLSKGRKGRQLVVRHKNNNKPLVEQTVH